jgi:hypothetical protein
MRSLARFATVALFVSLTVACILAGDGDVLIAVAPAAVLASLVATWMLPLRWPLLATTFLALTLENPSDTPACGQWKSPFYEVGAVLLVHLNVTLGHKSLAFSGLDLVLAFMFLVAGFRALTGSHVDGTPANAKGPIGTFAALSLGGVTWMWIYGVARGDAEIASSLWQVQRVAYLPLVLLLFQLAFRRPADVAALGKTVVAAACLKAVLAIYIRATVPPPPGEPILLYATSHADSMLFGVAFCAVLALLIHRPRGRRFGLAVGLLPLLLAGMVANGRRLAWVELALGVIAVVALTPWSPAKRALTRDRRVPVAPCVHGGRLELIFGSSRFTPCDPSSTRKPTLRPCGVTSRTTTSSTRCDTIPCSGRGTATATQRSSGFPTCPAPTRCIASCPTTASWACGPSAGSSDSRRSGPSSWWVYSSRRGRTDTP